MTDFSDQFRKIILRYCVIPKDTYYKPYQIVSGINS